MTKIIAGNPRTSLPPAPEGMSVHTSTGGTPFPGPGGGYPLPRSRWGIPPSLGGTPFPGRGIPPSQAGGYHLPRQGYPHLAPFPGGGTLPRWGGYIPPEQHSMYLLRGGRYASCVHAGGLSCVRKATLCWGMR